MSHMEAELKEWLKKRPYLEEIAGLHQIVSATVEKSAVPGAGDVETGEERTVKELEKGVPLLRAGEINGGMVEFAASLLVEIIDSLAAAPLTDKIDEYTRIAQKVFQKQPDLPAEIVREVLESNSIDKSKAALEGVDGGFIVFTAWSALSRALQPLKQQAAALLEKHPWRRGYCPVCGHLPAMGQLFRTAEGKGRERELICGCCQMNWRYKRIGCPYCDNTNQKQLKIIGLDDEPDLRIDTCDRCKSYLKTYTGEGQEKVALADWSTLHLDLIARKRGYKRAGYQMYGV